ncbi:hypothetical protein [Rufibacter roseolus]|uniref:hypothetical protein n=1 Tax=Rufibacter roseolus TaxID=2817375 RepID=UPI001B312F0D|nr:hypothetical protein [Rufibacter roseolus]
MNKETLLQGSFALTEFIFFSESGMWLLVFENDLRVQIESFWRLLENRRIKWTSKDNGQIYGHRTPIDLKTEIRKSLLNSSLNSIERNLNTGDLYLEFGNNLTFKILTDSSGYEPWEIIIGEKRIFGLGQGAKA